MKPPSSEQPASSMRLLTRNGMRGSELQSGWFTVRVPCCVGCGFRLRLARAVRFIGTMIMAAAWVCFGLFYLEPRWHLPGVACGLIALGGICVMLLAQFFWTYFHPPAFDLEISEVAVQGTAGTTRETFVDYKFRDRALALRFAHANGLLLESSR